MIKGIFEHQFVAANHTTTTQEAIYDQRRIQHWTRKQSKWGEERQEEEES
jgi:hypothetical protein